MWNSSQLIERPPFSHKLMYSYEEKYNMEEFRHSLECTIYTMLVEYASIK